MCVRALTDGATADGPLLTSSVDDELVELVEPGAPDERPECYTLVWGSDAPIPAAWMQQRLLFDGLGLVQDSNGPCGPLAALNALLLARMLEAEGVCGVACADVCCGVSRVDTHAHTGHRSRLPLHRGGGDGHAGQRDRALRAGR